MVCYILNRAKETLRRRVNEETAAELVQRLKQEDIQSIDSRVKDILITEGYLVPRDRNAHASVNEAINKYYADKGLQNEVTIYLEDYFRKAGLLGRNKQQGQIGTTPAQRGRRSLMQ